MEGNENKTILVDLDVLKINQKKPYVLTYGESQFIIEYFISEKMYHDKSHIFDYIYFLIFYFIHLLL